MFLKINNPKLTNLENTFIHRNGWFGVCDYAFTSGQDDWSAPLDNTTPCNPADIPYGSVVYVTPWGITKFLEEIHPVIQNRYILVTYCYGPIMLYADIVKDPKIIAWFGQTNCDSITFDKVRSMPLGILATTEIFNKRDEVGKFIEAVKKIPKTKMLYSNFISHVNDGQDRDVVRNLFKDKPYCTTVYLTPTWRKHFYEYMREMAQHKFVLSPLGDMCDCYRHYEAIMVGSIPILFNSPLNKLFEDLPAIIVEDYSVVTPEWMDQKWNEMQGKTYNMKKLYMQYWADLINEAKSK